MTNIHLQNLAPDFLEPAKIAHSAIWNQSVSFTRGEKLQVVAPSGSGKTSLIHFLYGLRKDFMGQLLFDDINYRDFSVEDIALHRSDRISIIFQDLRLFPDHTVFENIEIKRVLNPFYPVDKIGEMACRLGIKTKLQQLAGTCSYGEQQRIAIIRALQQPFDFLLADEPFSHLDETNRVKAMELIMEEVTARKAGIIIADLGVGNYFNADRILNL